MNKKISLNDTMLIDVINNSINVISVIDEKITLQQVINNDNKFQKVLENKIRLKDAIKENITINHVLSENINMNNFIKKDILLKDTEKDDDLVKIIKQNISIKKKYVVDKHLSLNKIINTNLQLKNIIYDGRKTNKLTTENIKKYIFNNDFCLFEDGLSDDEIKIKNITTKGKPIDQNTLLIDIIDSNIKLIEIINTNISLGDVMSKKKKYASIINRINNFAVKNNFNDENCFNNIKNNSKDDYDNSLVIRLLKYNYVIFFTKQKFFINKKLGIIKYLGKYEILCLQYEYKNYILKEIEIINFFIKEAEQKNKLDIAKDLSLKKLKLLYFFEGLIEPNSIYKKISFSNEELFLPFDKYSIKKIEYKLKAFSQIADKMGATNIETLYDKETIASNDLNMSIDAGGGSISGKNRIMNTTKEGVVLGFDYTNNSYNFNLDKFDIIDIIENENEFFLSKEEFESDIDLKFLINDRCINFIKEYNTQLVFKYANELERKIFSKARFFGLSLGKIKLNTEETRITIKINFLNIYDHPDDVTGYNIYNLKEGFFHLSNLINHQIKQIEDKNEESILEIKKNIYYKIYNFMLKHLIHIQEKKFSINTKYNVKENLPKVFEQIINLNMSDSEIKTLFYEFFNNNMNYKHFEKLRDLIITPMLNFYDTIINYHNFGNHQINFYEDIFSNNNNLINKVLFNSYQYHMIASYKIKFIDIMEKYIIEITEGIRKKYIEQRKKNISFFKELILEHYQQLKNDINENNLANLIIQKMNNITVLLNYLVSKYNLIDNKNENINEILANINYFLERYELNIDNYDIIKNNIRCNFEYDNYLFDIDINDPRYRYYVNIKQDVFYNIIKNSITFNPEFETNKFINLITNLIIESSKITSNQYTKEYSNIEGSFIDILEEPECSQYINKELLNIFKADIDNFMIMIRPNKNILTLFNSKIKDIIERIIKLNYKMNFNNFVGYWNKETYNFLMSEYKIYFDKCLKEYLNDMIEEGFKILETLKNNQINSFINDGLFYKLKGPNNKYLLYKNIIPVLDHDIYQRELKNINDVLNDIFITNPIKFKEQVFLKLYNSVLNVALENKIITDLYYFAELPANELSVLVEDISDDSEKSSPNKKPVLISQRSLDSLYNSISKTDDHSPYDNSPDDRSPDERTTDGTSLFSKLDDNFSLNKKINSINRFNRRKRNIKYRHKNKSVLVCSKFANENKKPIKLSELDSKKLYEIYSNLLDEEYKLKVGYFFEKNNINYFNLPSQKELYLKKLKTIYKYYLISDEYIDKLDTSPVYNFIAWYGYIEKESNFMTLDEYLDRISKILKICFTKSFSFKNGLLEYEKENDKEQLQEVMHRVLEDNFSDESEFFIQKIIKPLITILINNFDNFIKSDGNKVFVFDKNDDKSQNYIPIKKTVDKFIERIVVNYYLSKGKLVEIDFQKYNIDIYANYSKHRLLYKFDNLIAILKDNHEDKNQEPDTFDELSN
jgi:hypothetical protein